MRFFKLFTTMLDRLRSPQRAFLLLGSIFGLLLLVLTPPFHVPDEPRHFFRAYGLSEGQLIAERRGDEVGSMLPASLDVTAAKTAQNVYFHPEQKIDPAIVLQYLRYPLIPTDRSFVTYPNTAMYPPLAYAPQVLAITLSKPFQPSPLVMFYLARLLNLFTWLAMVYAAIRITPLLPWIWFLVALSPMSLYEAASVSPDAFTNGVLMLMLAIALHWMLRTEPLSRTNKKLLWLIGIVPTLLKQAYLGFSLLFLLIPRERFSGLQGKRRLLGVLALSMLAMLLFWKYSVEHLHTPLLSYTSVEKQLEFITSNPLLYGVVLMNTVFSFGQSTLVELIGRLGYLDTELPELVIVGYYVLLLLALQLGANPTTSITPRQRLLLLMIFLVNVLSITTLIYLSWSPVGAPAVMGLQGRYFIPCVPLACVILSRKHCPQWLQPWQHRQHVIFLFAVLLALIITVQTLISRFYGL